MNHLKLEYIRKVHQETRAARQLALWGGFPDRTKGEEFGGFEACGTGECSCSLGHVSVCGAASQPPGAGAVGIGGLRPRQWRGSEDSGGGHCANTRVAQY